MIALNKIILPCGHFGEFPDENCKVCRKYTEDPSYRGSVVRHQAAIRPHLDKLPTLPCRHLRERTSAFRFRCAVGIVNQDGLGGVKPCCDCGVGKCVKYSPEDD